MNSHASSNTTAAARTAQGSGRERNEDSFLIDEGRGVFVLADGLGAQPGGSRASCLAADGLMREAALLLDRRAPKQASLVNAITQSFLNVNEAILNISKQLPRFRGMGASAVMVIVDGLRLYVAGAGDCRAYLIHDEKAERLTVDQTVLQLLIDARLSVDSYQQAKGPRILWSYLGNPKFAPQIRCEELQRSDRLILVTNGITRVVKDSLIGRLGTSAEHMAAAANSIVNTALALGTVDDATCLAVSLDDKRTPDQR